MKNRDAFSAFHPAVLCGYYALVLVFSMFLTHPLCLAASLLGALSYAAKLRGGRAVLRSLAWMAPVWLLAAAVNVLFNQEGATILTYFSSGNPLTLESMLSGLSAGAAVRVPFRKNRPDPESPDFCGKFLDFSDVEPGKCRRNGGFHARARLRPAGPDGVFDFPL